MRMLKNAKRKRIGLVGYLRNRPNLEHTPVEWQRRWSAGPRDSALEPAAVMKGWRGCHSSRQPCPLPNAEIRLWYCLQAKEKHLSLNRAKESLGEAEAPDRPVVNYWESPPPPPGIWKIINTACKNRVPSHMALLTSGQTSSLTLEEDQRQDKDEAKWKNWPGGSKANAGAAKTKDSFLQEIEEQS